MHSVAYSSRFVAAMRAVETGRTEGDPLFADTFAPILAGDDAVSHVREALARNKSFNLGGIQVIIVRLQI